MAAQNSGPSKRNRRRTITVTAGQLRPPSGSYDPILNAQARAARRGYGDLGRDIEQQRERGAEDFTSQSDLLGRSRDRGLYDLTTGRDRSLADILTGETRLGEDKDTALANLDLQYDRLGQKQAEQGRVFGASGGLMAKSQAIRDANETRDQQPILTQFDRQMADYGTTRARLGEDFTLGSTRIGEDYDTSKGLLDRDYGRVYGEMGDLTKQLTRAGRENTFFQQDIAEQRAYQAAQTGWESGVPRGITKPGKYRRVNGKWRLVRPRPNADPATGGVLAPS